MRKSLRDQTVLITGAGGGFGQAMIRQFLQVGCYLILADRNRQQLIEATEQALTAAGAQPLGGKILGFIEADLSQAAGSDTLYAQCVAITPAIDILVNNAGIGLYGLLSDVPQEKWEALMQVNLLAPMRLVAKFLPLMITRKRGHIVNVSSVAGLVGTPGLSAYCASKFGLRGLGEALANDLRPYGIDVTNIYPFFARTPILQAERFGKPAMREVPDSIVYDPDFVIAALIEGIQARKLHVYPGAIPRQIDILRRVAPWALPLLNRLMME